MAHRGKCIEIRKTKTRCIESKNVQINQMNQLSLIINGMVAPQEKRK